MNRKETIHLLYHLSYFVWDESRIRTCDRMIHEVTLLYDTCNILKSAVTAKQGLLFFQTKYPCFTTRWISFINNKWATTQTMTIIPELQFTLLWKSRTWTCDLHDFCRDALTEGTLLYGIIQKIWKSNKFKRVAVSLLITKRKLDSNQFYRRSISFLRHLSKMYESVISERI